VTTPHGTFDVVTLEGQSADRKNDSTWKASAKPEPSGKPQTYVLRARNSDSLWASEVVHLIRQADATGPDLTWVSPIATWKENGTLELHRVFGNEEFRAKLG
jgi:hypothetical protein